MLWPDLCILMYCNVLPRVGINDDDDDDDDVLGRSDPVSHVI